MAGRKESQELFQLIKSMTPEEKGYFKKYAQRHSNNESESLKLFNLVDKQESYNEQCLKSQINHLPVVKSNLLEQLLQALLISNSTPSLNQIINKNIAYSEILYDRGLQRKALQLAKETFQLAIANDLIDRALVVHHIIENMRVGTLRQSERWQSIHTYFDTSSKLADLLKALSKYHLEERKMTFINRENEREKAAKLLSSIDIKFLEDKTNLAIPKFHFSRTVSLFGYYYASNRLDKMYIVSKEGLDYCRKVYLKQLSQSRAVSYMVALFNHQDVAIEAGDLNGVLTELANLEKLRINSKRNYSALKEAILKKASKTEQVFLIAVSTTERRTAN